MRTSSSTAPTSAVATWTPTLGAGEYLVSFYNPATAGASTDAKITVVQNGTTTTFTVNEASGTPGYVVLGSFYFAGTGGEYVSISQGATAGLLYASAVQFAREGSTPAVTVPAAQSTPFNTALIFSSANGNAFSITDASINNNIVQLTLSATNGTLTLGTTSGLTVTAGANGSATLTVQGTLTAINAALSGLTFTPTANYSGAANIALNYSDLGVGGAGPAADCQHERGHHGYVSDLHDRRPSQRLCRNGRNLGHEQRYGLQWRGHADQLFDRSDERRSHLDAHAGAGEYLVSFYNPATAGASTDAKITVVQNGTTTTFTVNEASGTPGYVVLGSFYFAGTGGEYVSISQGATAGLLYASAVQFAREGSTPAVTVPAAQSTLFNTALIFSSANGNAFSITDASINNNIVQLALSATNGTLTLGTTSGLTVTAGANGSATFTVQGTLTAINAALSGLTFTPTANYSGAANIALNYSDLGVGGAGPAQTVSTSVAITVTFPIYTIVDQASGYAETAGTWSTSSVTGYNGVAMRTSASTSPTSAVATWTPTLGAGEYLVSFYNPATAGASTDAKITVVQNGTTTTFTVNEASGTPGYVVLGSFYFAGTGGEYVSISQGATAGLLYASAVQFAREGSTPAVTVPAAQSTPFNTALIFSSANGNAFSITDASINNNIVQLTLSATNGTLTLGTTSGLTVTAGANGSATFTVQGTLTAINAALSGLTFTPTANYGGGAANVALNYSDLGVGGAGPVQTVSTSVVITVKFPVYTIVDQASGYAETAGTWSTSSVTGYNGVAMRTSASTSPTSAVATWTPTLGAGEYLVSFYNPAKAGASTDAKITVVQNGTTTTFTVNEASGTPGYVVLGSFYFAGTGGEYVSISQGATAGLLYASAVQFAREGSTPAVTVPAAQSTLFNTALIFSSANGNAFSITDASINNNIVQLTLSATNGTLTLGTTSGLTVTAGANGSATFTVQGTLTAINAALSGLTFTPTANYGGAANVSLNYSDLGVGGAGSVQTVSTSVVITVKFPVYTIVDRASGYAETAGTWSTSSVTGYNGVAMRTSASTSPTSAVATWTPTLGAGEYLVSFYNPAKAGASIDAKITVFHYGLTTTYTVNEASGTPGYVILGSCYFAGTGGEYVSISQGAMAGLLYASAVQFAREGYTPTVTVPAAQSTPFNTALVFSSSNGNALSFTDASINNNIVQLTLSATNGTLTLGTTSGLTVTTGANGSATLTVQGTLTAINAALSGLTFTPTTNYNGVADIALNYSDLGVGGAGPAQTVSTNIAIKVK